MRMRTQLGIWVVGIIIIPILMMSVFLIGERLSKNFGLDNSDYQLLHSYLSAHITSSEWNSFSELLKNKPEDINMVLFDENFEVIFSLISDFHRGDRYSWQQLEKYQNTLSSRYMLVLSHPWENSKFIMIARFDQQHKPPQFYFVLVFMIILVTLLIFSIILAFLIARANTQAIMKLEKATRQVAQGELDTWIDVKGNDDIISLVESFNNMRLALKEEGARKARLLMGISHDLKSPLALMQGYLEAYEDGIVDDKTFKEEHLKSLLAKVDQLNEMVNDLMDYVQEDSGQWRQRLGLHPLAPLLKNLGKSLESDADFLQRKLFCKIDLPEDLQIPFDPRYLQRSLDNLLNNALRYTKPGDEISLKAWNEPEQIIIQVEDTGPGIPVSDLDFVFDPFFRGSSSRKEPGMGLGLAIVKSLIESHGWSISVASPLGAQFTIRIPKAKFLQP